MQGEVVLRSELDGLPPVVQEISAHIGLPSAIKLVNSFGGTTIRIPKGGRLIGREILTRLAEVIGEEATKKLSHMSFGEPIYIPRCQKHLLNIRNQEVNQSFIDKVRHGRTANSVVAELAREYQLCDRWIWVILKKTVSQTENESVDLHLLTSGTETKMHEPARRECMQ